VSVGPVVARNLNGGASGCPAGAVRCTPATVGCHDEAGNARAVTDSATLHLEDMTMSILRRVSPLSALVLALAAPPVLAQHQAGAGQPADHADHFEHRFNDAAEYAKRFDDPARDEWQMPGRVLDALKIAPGQVVADIGAGTGYFAVRLAKLPAAPKVYAVDVEASMVEHLTHRAMHEGLQNVVAVKADANGTNLPEPADVALLVDVFHHLPNRPAYFTALKALLKPGARLAIVDFRKGSPEGPPEHFRFTPEQISAELAQAGFALVESHDFLPRQHFLIYQAK
jgi:ubiquinone/menaquinone biosynthesis C-methylase UbiE